MSLLTGDRGRVLIGAKPVADITRWSLRTRTQAVAYASSATAGYRRQIAGAREAGGEIDFLLNLADAVTGDLNEGSHVTLLLHLDATRTYSVPAVIESLSLEVHINEGKLVGGRATFLADGAWSTPLY